MRPALRGTAEAERAFSLVEVVVATAVFLVAVLGLFAALQSSMQVDAMSREKTYAHHAAITKLEEVVGTTWTSVLSFNGATFPVMVSTAPGQAPARLIPPTSTTACGLINVTTTATDMVRVEVSVRWRSIVGADLEVVLRSLVSKH